MRARLLSAALVVLVLFSLSAYLAASQHQGPHPQGDFEGRYESKVRPISASKDEPVADRSTDRVGRHEHPLRAGRVLAGEL